MSYFLKIKKQELKQNQEDKRILAEINQKQREMVYYSQKIGTVFIGGIFNVKTCTFV